MCIRDRVHRVTNIDDALRCEQVPVAGMACGPVSYTHLAIVISFIIAGIGCMFAGLCYSEFAGMVPVAGSAYAYSYATLGEFVAWFVGWNLVLEYMMACSTVAVGWSRYAVNLLDYFGTVSYTHLHGERT